MSDASSRYDGWADGDAYEAYIGRWSRLVAREFLAWLDLPARRRWLDVGCGTGALTQAILDQAEPEAVKGLDRSEAYLAAARRRIPDSRASFAVADAAALAEADSSYDAAVSGLVLNFVPEPGKALAEMARVVRPGGHVAVYLWDYAGEMQVIRHFWDAAVELDPGAAALDEAARFPICNPEPLAACFADAGLREVEVRAIDVPADFRDFDDFWAPFLGGQGPAPGYVASLPGERRERLRDLLARRLQAETGRPLRLLARAWAARGLK